VTELRLIAGSGRSGTTWLLDAIASANGLRPVFEPLNPFASEMGRRYAHQALGRDDSHDDLKSFLESVIAGRQARLWTQYRRQNRWLFPSKARLRKVSDVSRMLRSWARFLKEAPGLARMATYRDPLVKCIWSNLMMGWLVRQFDCRLVVLVRHPGAVIESELRNKWNASFALDRFRSDPRFQELTKGRYQALLKQELTPIEGLAALWLIENQWIVEQAPSMGAEVVFYEHLKSAPVAAWERVRRALDVRNVPSVAILAKPSQQSAPSGSVAAARVTEPPPWLTALTQTQTSQIQSILDRGEFSLYSMDAEEPR
jgi:hypothetical protein